MKLIDDKRGSIFINIIAIIGAILIFVGIAWLIAKNWHQIPDFLKIIILVFSTIAAFVSGVLLKQYEHEGVGRALIALGALLYILSLFLISQTYNLATTMQHYAWLLFLAWTIIFITAYFLDSKENLFISLVNFFIWVTLQYLASISKAHLSSDGGFIFSFILIFLGAGALLYGLSAFHNSIKHRFTNIYRFWTVFYFLLIFYILSFQYLLPLISEYSFEGGAFSFFLVLFIIFCFIGFILGTLFSVSKSSLSIKEILGFIGILIILFILILSTKAGAGLIGNCYIKMCYDFKTSSECISAPDSLVCEWKENICMEIGCYDFKTEEECNSALLDLECNWQNNRCITQKIRAISYETCNENKNQKDNCIDNPLCNWKPSYRSFNESLPTILWFLWILNNFIFIGFIILILWYGQTIGSTKIINLGFVFFILEIITRYIGFWIDSKGYFAFSILAIFGGLILILGAWLIPKWRKKLLNETN